MMTENQSFHPEFFEKICPILESCIPGFRSNEFIFRIFNNSWPDLGFPERVCHISSVLESVLPLGFPDAAAVLIKLARAFHVRGVKGRQTIFLIHVIEKNRAVYPELSARAVEEIRWLTMPNATGSKSIVHRRATFAAMN